jgi:hypothetical protein
MNQLCTPNLSHWRGSPHVIVDVHVLVDVVGFLKSYKNMEESPTIFCGIPIDGLTGSV